MLTVTGGSERVRRLPEPSSSLSRPLSLRLLSSRLFGGWLGGGRLVSISLWRLWSMEAAALLSRLP